MTRRARALRLYRACAHLSSQGRRYRYGGGHSVPLSSIRPSDSLDCSSSTCLALKRAGLWAPAYASTSGLIARSWGVPGRGRYFTVWAHAGHVWIELRGLGRFVRFDTSPWGSGGRGPRVRLGRRTTWGFTPRHWPGL